MIGGRVDCTEIDLRIGDLMIEAKLTETDFQVVRFELAERYSHFHAVFDPDRLPRRANRLRIVSTGAWNSCGHCGGVPLLSDL